MSWGRRSVSHCCSWLVFGPVHTTPEKFDNRVQFFTLKTRPMLSVHTTPEKFENATITGHFGFVFEENSGRKITWLWWRHRSRKARAIFKMFSVHGKTKSGVFKFLRVFVRFRKAPFSNCFSSTRKRKPGVFKFLRFEERFQKAPFSRWRISVDGRPNRWLLRFQIYPA